MKYVLILAWPAGIAAIIAVAAMLARRPTGGFPLARASERLPTVGGTRGALGDAARLAVIAFAGACAAFLVMLALGAAWVVHHGGSIDQPIYRFIVDHHVHRWVHVMNRLTKVGNAWTTWGAAIAGGGALAIVWRRRRWLPPTVLLLAIVVDHYETLGIRHVFGRLGPPNSPHGTYPTVRLPDS